MRGSSLLVLIFAVFAVAVVSQFGNDSPSDVVEEVQQSHSDTTAVAVAGQYSVSQAKGTRVLLSSSSSYSSSKQLMVRKLQNPTASEKCEEQDCEELDDCIKFDENCVCDEKDEDIGKCYLELPCDSIPCATDNDCTSSINQLCKCPPGGGMCYDQLL